MPLTVERRPGREGWWITGTVTPAGAKQGVRVRRRAASDDRRLADEEAAALTAEIVRNYHHGERSAAIGWGEAVKLYLAHEPRSAGTQAFLIALTRHFRDTPLDRIDQAAVNRARDVVLRPNPSPATVLRNVVTPIRAVMAFAHHAGKGPAPRIKAPKQPKGRTPCLLPAEFEALRDAIAPQHRDLLTWFICTGCRRGETWALEWASVDLQGGTARLWGDTTKTGSGRLVRLPPAAVAMLANRARDGAHVFSDADPRKALATAARKASVTIRGVHDLRHSWASWHYALHRDLMRLRDDGGWATVGQVETYAHRMPAGHEAAIRRVWGLATTGRIRRVA